MVRTESTGPDESAEMRCSTTICPLTGCGESALPRITRPETVRTSPATPGVPVAGGSGPCALDVQRGAGAPAEAARGQGVGPEARCALTSDL